MALVHRALLPLLFCLAFVSMSQADTLFLTDGNILQGKIVEENPHFILLDSALFGIKKIERGLVSRLRLDNFGIEEAVPSKKVAPPPLKKEEGDGFWQSLIPSRMGFLLGYGPSLSALEANKKTGYYEPEASGGSFFSGAFTFAYRLFPRGNLSGSLSYERLHEELLWKKDTFLTDWKESFTVQTLSLSLGLEYSFFPFLFVDAGGFMSMALDARVQIDANGTSEELDLSDFAQHNPGIYLAAGISLPVAQDFNFSFLLRFDYTFSDTLGTNQAEGLIAIKRRCLSLMTGLNFKL